MYEFVKNTSKYWGFILELRNDPAVKPGFIQQGYIKEEDHYRFMESLGENFYICLDNEVAVGYIGVINRDIRVATHPDHQGKGIAKFMVEELMKKHPDSFAKVKLENEASLKLFESCGFKKKFFILER